MKYPKFTIEVLKKERGKQNANVVQKGSDNSHSSIWEDLKDGLHR